MAEQKSIMNSVEINRALKRIAHEIVEKNKGVINEDQLLAALDYQKSQPQKIRLGTAIVRKGFTTENVIVEALKQQLGIDSVVLASVKISQDILKMVPDATILKARLENKPPWPLKNLM